MSDVDVFGVDPAVYLEDGDYIQNLLAAWSPRQPSEELQSPPQGPATATTTPAPASLTVCIRCGRDTLEKKRGSPREPAPQDRRLPRGSRSSGGVPGACLYCPCKIKLQLQSVGPENPKPRRLSPFASVSDRRDPKSGHECGQHLTVLGWVPDYKGRALPEDPARDVDTWQEGHSVGGKILRGRAKK